MGEAGAGATWFGLVEMGLVFGVVLAWAVRELVVVRRLQREDRKKRGEPDGGGPS